MIAKNALPQDNKEDNCIAPSMKSMTIRSQNKWMKPDTTHGMQTNGASKMTEQKEWRKNKRTRITVKVANKVKSNKNSQNAKDEHNAE